MSNVNQSNQNVVDLPKLRGSKKQLGWAYKIRERFAERNPDSDKLMTELEAKFWIDNKSSLIGDEKLPKALPQLSGSENQIKWAFAIRSKFADVFPESALLRSQTDSKFWIENRRVFDFAVLGFKLAPSGDASQEE
ncbi:MULTISPECIES: hypothetical protein [Vibrio]|uniref:hypothetical protein n=1 Tax=Vibrio TaxID=662 RepID=UPI0011F0E061|nr:hypothetical protein [Vibrio cholerae]EKO3939102.1 hypothetical protein [Vibrio metschnikovii]EJX7572344.1 hypothetical protein [Vibrio cholerae]EKG0020387.1 hypothetical protein [Vibrio cholerae]ELN7718375.1 hypothetical protein [Vibrio cholerae]QEO42696.1 hypothetical protein F0316_13965 [Vibrio cholerae]